jgi:hypothetical protein
LDDHPNIPTRRPVTKAGKPDPHRLQVHVGALMAAVAAEKAPQEEVDAENLMAGVMDVMRKEKEREARQAKIREAKRGRGG